MRNNGTSLRCHARSGAAGPRKPDEGTSADGRPMTVVGIGASAGGLKALTAFFEAVPADTG
ncbi:MAG: hypothetical protein ACRELV_02660, partial [Longimicrobiales bacterium]